MHVNLRVPALLILLGLSVSAGAVSGSEPFDFTGQVTYQDLEGGFFGIRTADGLTYLPLNLPDAYAVDGLIVTGNATREPDISTIQMWGEPIRIMSISPSRDGGGFEIPWYGSLPSDDPRYTLRMSGVLLNVSAAIQIGLDAIDQKAGKMALRLSGIDPAEPDFKTIMEDGLTVPGVYEVCFIDTTGRLVMIVPEMYEKFIGENVGSQLHNQRLFCQPVPRVSEQFTTIEGKDSVLVSYPVFSATNQVAGYLSLICDPVEIAEIYGLSALEETPFSLRIVQPDGMVLYDEEGSSGDIWNGLTGDDTSSEKAHATHYQVAYAGYDSFIPGGDEQKTERKSVWTTAGLHGTSWRVMILD